MQAIHGVSNSNKESTRHSLQFPSETGICQAWLYRPAPRTEEERRPCIIMAHGLGGTRDAGLEAYARRFAGAGYVVVLFDYRHFGDSSGEPRQLFSVRRQLEDWASAISFARQLEDVNPEQIALWGTSFSGGHVIVAAARDGNIAAVSAQCPMMDALTATWNYLQYAGIGAFLKLGGLGLLDQLRAILMMSPIYIPLIAPPGQLAAMSSHDAASGFGAITPAHWRNEICARYALTLAGYRPIAHTRKLKCQTLIQVCLRDSLAPAKSAIEAARRLGDRAELQQYDCGHFDIYVGDHFERAISEQLAFFNRVILGI